MRMRFALPILAMAACFAFAPAKDAKAFYLLDRMWYGHGVGGGGGCCGGGCGSCCEPTCCEPTCCEAAPTCCAPRHLLC